MHITSITSYLRPIVKSCQSIATIGKLIEDIKFQGLSKINFIQNIILL